MGRHWLFALSGVMWCAVGVLLCDRAWGWIAGMSAAGAAACGSVGLAGAAVAGSRGFGGMARRNIARLDAKRRRICVFAFIPWRSYLIVPVMIGLGLGLRHSGLPREILAPVYLTVGGGLFVASLAYFRRLLAATR